MLTTIYIDGSCLPRNPDGVASYGFIIEVDGFKVKEEYGVVGHENVSNNVAEYAALIRALQWLKINGVKPDKVVVKSDSQLLIKQLKGQYAVKSPRLIPLYREVKELAKDLPSIEYHWIPRGENEDADSLSKKAYEEYMQSHPDLAEKYKRYLVSEKQRTLLKQLGIEVPPWLPRHEVAKTMRELKR